MESRFTDRIERAIREERRRAALSSPAGAEPSARGAAGDGMASAAADDASLDPSAGMATTCPPTDQPAAGDAVTTQAG